MVRRHNRLLVAGYVITRTQKVETNQTWPLAARAGLKAPWMAVDDKEGEP